MKNIKDMPMFADYMATNITTRPPIVINQYGEPVESPKYKVIYMDGRPGPIVKSKYKIVPNDVAIRKMDLTLKDSGLKFNLESAYVNDSKTRFITVVSFPEHEIQIKNGEILRPKVIFKNGIAADSAFEIRIGYIQMICVNGIIVGEMIREMRRFHSPSLNVEKLMINMAGVMDILQSRANFYSNLTEKQLDLTSGVHALIAMNQEKIITKKTLDGAVFSWEKEKRASEWGLYSAITNTLTHDHNQNSMVSVENQSRNVDRVFRFGLIPFVKKYDEKEQEALDAKSIQPIFNQQL